ncbi:hypothetical protein B0T17DRAFT_598582 [Bombardia bombarda]|uniref:Uncharacterized protein n=1 Tax=Bombardia bombarda TaxID=252184 RepID=A0AA39XAJ7_9PEZI|nr:hypothetical protein B0T17DRAFT_598582 [Bombardia bombarda]
MLTGNTPPSDSGQKYTVSFTMVPPLTPHDTDVSYEDAPWGVAIKFDNVSLSSIQKGLYWTTRNIDLLSGRQKSWRNIFSEAEWTSPWRYEFVRSWRLRDSTTEKPYRGWSGDVQLCVHSAETLSGFSLGKQLRRQNILFAYVTDEKTGKRVFNFDAERERSNVCHLPLGGKPFDLVWLWPMESVVPKGSGSGDDVEGDGAIVVLVLVLVLVLAGLLHRGRTWWRRWLGLWVSGR